MNNDILSQQNNNLEKEEINMSEQVLKTHGLGCLPYEKDDRDYNFGDLISGGGNYPISYKSLIPDFRMDQGLSQMCVSFATSVARYMYEINDSGNAKIFSPAYIYANRAPSDYQGEGMIVRQALSGLVNNGVCHLSKLSFTGSYQESRNRYLKVKAEADANAKPFRISSYYALYTDDQIKQAILTTGAAVAAYNVYDNWYNVKADGNIGSNYGTSHGSHCILIVGWTSDNKWIIINSWGSVWGDNGIGYIPMTNPKNEAWCMLDNVQEVFFKSLKDVEGHWAKASIDKAVQQGVLKGYEDGSFKPDNNITRAEASAIIAKIGGYDNDTKNIRSIFPDIYPNDWFWAYVSYCYQKGFISGYQDGEFKPYNELTRAEACKILCSVAKLNVRVDAKTNSFNDIKGHWAYRWIATMDQQGYLTGYEDGSFKPDNKITRAEFITMIDRMGLISK